MTEPKFKVGDRVVTAHYGNGYNNMDRDGIEFVITAIKTERNPQLLGERYWYKGDRANRGIWESRLELVPTEFAPEAAPDVTESRRTELFYQPFPGAEWVSIYADQANGLRAKGYPVRKVTTETTITVEYLP